MPAQTKFKHECSPEHAHQFYHWITTRGGVATWKSINLSNPGARWSTPALDKEGKPYTKPNWQCASEPEIVTDAKDVGVYTAALYKAFPVGLKRGDGFSFVLSDGAQRKVDKYLEECKEKYGNGFYKKGVLPDVNASIGIYYTTGIIPLDEWIKQNGTGNPEDWE